MYVTYIILLIVSKNKVPESDRPQWGIFRGNGGILEALGTPIFGGSLKVSQLWNLGKHSSAKNWHHFQIILTKLKIWGPKSGPPNWVFLDSGENLAVGTN